MPEVRSPTNKAIELPHIAPNYQAETAYTRAIRKMIANMTASYNWWIERAYEQAVEANVDAGKLPDLAQDAAPRTPKGAQNRLFSELDRLRKYWAKYFDDFARKVATDAITDFYAVNTRGWTSRLRSAGFDIDLTLTPSQKLIFDVKVKENVALIKSIAADYHTDVEGIVTRNYLAGRDLATMAEQIKKTGKVSTNRAALIATDQSNKACAQMNSARQRELDIKFAYWKHSHAGKEPRVNHLRASREDWIFDTSKGIDFNDKFGHVLPGEAIRCACTSVSIIPAIGRGPKFELSDLTPVPGFSGAYTLKQSDKAG
ncbi:hypothetical protein [Paraburkholderia sp.]|jgi:hypothetical protein|uniref:hypothetical protein n=1 Tax=Paraburkholderia sp. TaxID=1926495 RepID=UPI002F41C9FD